MRIKLVLIQEVQLTEKLLLQKAKLFTRALLHRKWKQLPKK